MVTGASRGIGFAIAAEIARRGHRLALLGRHPKSLEGAAQQLKSSASDVRAFVCDVRDETQVQSTVKQILDWGKRVDVLVNNAGIAVLAAVQDLSEADWDATLDTNLRGAFLCAKAVIPHMIEQRAGHIINISSLAGKNAVAGASAYCASKWGLMGLTYCMAEELRVSGIRVSVVCPGTVHTDILPYKGKNPQKMLQPEDVARVVGWLLEQGEQSFVTEILLRPIQNP